MTRDSATTRGVAEPPSDLVAGRYEPRLRQPSGVVEAEGGEDLVTRQPESQRVLAGEAHVVDVGAGVGLADDEALAAQGHPRRRGRGCRAAGGGLYHGEFGDLPHALDKRRQPFGGE